MNTDQIIDKIQAARAKNNLPWMQLMRIAFKYAPDEAAACMQQICDMDAEITGLARQLANAKAVVKLTPAKWQEMTGIEILDPDGWRTDNKDFSDLIDEDEWNRRSLVSTVRIRIKK